ncbi:TIGR03767 family metallophosphoesterase [Nocardioides sp. YIM 152315]|uniref:TIGR03767 family metallophosphoesterase n=1 Tax=Nocardioides sp. YIM 152315 TaxID=3031760 RepID=UPI0023DAA27C|nr:TIGR03767 family metallophosphoesterase [Nocardioides sp. YIM 152315]MDF1602792.1 TIGR03767 family metallophosphoesterase [Nocardioides sp. YIM 152315]
MQISRRDLFRSSAAVGGTAALGSAGLADAAVAGPAVRGTTTSTVLGKGDAGAGGWRPVVRLAGEKHVVRTGLGAKPGKGRVRRRKAMAAFAQLSDVHIMDTQSPVRAELGEFASSSAYRPQEMLGAFVADAMVREINKIKRGPATGRKLEFTIQTGDNSDTAQYNEVRWNIDLLDGGRKITVDSGDPSRYEGVMDQSLDFWDVNFWHPDGTPVGKPADLGTQSGFPTYPGLLDAARRPFTPEGLNMPWYAAMGNHDGLVQGNFPINASQNSRATGTAKVLSTDGTRIRQVTPDRNRRLLDRSEWVDEHFDTTGTPKGHGFTAENRSKNTAYYYFDRGAARFVVLDTVAEVGDNGALDKRQHTWLTRLLDRSRDKVVVLFSHHPLSSFEDQGLARKIRSELVRRENVVAWVNGHTHTNHIWAHPRRKKGKVVGGFWEINTASHIDWPQQARLLEIADNRDGSLSIFTTMIDHSGSLAFNGDLDDPKQLAGLSRLLAANDWQERDNERRGERTARNVELLVRAPKFLRAKAKKNKKKKG